MTAHTSDFNLNSVHLLWRVMWQIYILEDHSQDRKTVTSMTDSLQTLKTYHTTIHVLTCDFQNKSHILSHDTFLCFMPFNEFSSLTPFRSSQFCAMLFGANFQMAFASEILKTSCTL